MNMHEVLESIGFEPFHPALTALAAYRAGSLSVPISPGTPRYENLVRLALRLGDVGAPASAEDIKKWFLPIVAHVKIGNMGPDEIVARAEGVAFALEGKPRFFFSRALLREVMLKCEWLPTAAEIWPLIESNFREFERLRADLNAALMRPVNAALPSSGDAASLGFDPNGTVMPIRKIS
jgi:hypothetical protein